MDIEVYSEFNDTLEKAWTKLGKNAVMTPFQSYTWLSLWQSKVGSPLNGIVPQIVVVKKKEKIIAIMPFGIRRWNLINVLEWLGGIHTDYMGPLIHEEWDKYVLDFQILWLDIQKMLLPHDVLHFQKQTKKIGPNQNPFNLLFDCQAKVNAYRSSLKGNWEEFYQDRIKKKTRADSRRQRRRLEKKGKLKFKLSESDVENNEIIQNMIRQKRQRYRNTKVWDMLSTPEYRDFYSGFSSMSDNSFKVHCAALMVDNVMVATHVGMVNEKCFYYLMPAHEGGEWQRYSPGRLLLEHLVEWAFENRLKIFDFTIGDDPYKKDWCDEEVELYECLHTSTLKGKVYVFYQYIKEALRRMPWLGSNVSEFYTWVRNKSNISD